LEKQNLTIKDRIKNIVERWYILEPLYFIIFTTHNLVINVNIKTMRSGNGKIEFNPDFVDNIDDIMLSEVLKCEIVRILLKHPYTRRKENTVIAYQASNITIKEYNETKLNIPTAAQQFGTYTYDRKHFEFYYNKLLEQQKAVNQQNNKKNNGDNQEKNSEQKNKNSDDKSEYDKKNNLENQDKNSNKFSKSDEDEAEENENSSEDNQNLEGEPEKEKNKEKTLNQGSSNQDNDNKPDIEEYINAKTSGFENAENWDKDELIQSLINDKIQIAIQTKSWGTVSNSLREQIIASLKPKIDYRHILKAFRASVLSQKRILTRMKPNRRYDFLYMGSRRDFCTKLLFAVDVSGSMSKENLIQGFSIINHFFKYGIEQIDVIQFDTMIQGKSMTLKKARFKTEVKGRGGTNFQCVLDYIEDKNYDGLIIFTDGYAPKPKLKRNRKTRILWVFDSEENYNYMYKSLKDIGKAVFLKEK